MWFKFSNLGLALGMVEILHHCGKRVKTKIRKFCRLIHKSVEVTGEKLVWSAFCPPPILNTGSKRDSNADVFLRTLRDF